jgi:rhamnogalacturonan endolyase
MKQSPKLCGVLRPDSLQVLTVALVFLACLCAGSFKTLANVPGAILSGSNPNVTLTDNGSTVTISNGIVSILCNKSSAVLTQISYTYNNGAGTTTTQLLTGGHSGGEFYWECGGFTGSSGNPDGVTYSVVVDPSVGDTHHNVGDYAEISLLGTSSTAGTVEIHFSMLRGSPGFYATAIWNHRAQDSTIALGETRSNIYNSPIFNWMTVDPTKNQIMEIPNGSAVAVPTGPAEVTLWTSGTYQGIYDDKYKNSAILGLNKVWGYSSVGSSGANIGLWNVTASTEYYNGGPLKRELTCQVIPDILNMYNGFHYWEQLDANFTSGELWTKTYGPYFIYCNYVPASVTNEAQAASQLYTDALAQQSAEVTAWPYSWLYNTNYTPASGRGTVTGALVISDTGNPNASAANMWVGVVQQPATSTSSYDFQEWLKPYQFWMKTAADGSFTIPAVISGTGYTFYAFGPGTPGTYMSQKQTGGNPPELYTLPASPFSVTVNSGSATSLGTVSWTPTRVGPTVFEIGYPDRTSGKFRHGDDWWVGDIGPSPTAPSPIWGKFMEYPNDFQTG